jgi:hypothetical protein
MSSTRVVRRKSRYGISVGVIVDDGEGLQCFAEPGWPEYQGRMCDGDADDLMTSNHRVS